MVCLKIKQQVLLYSLRFLSGDVTSSTVRVRQCIALECRIWARCRAGTLARRPHNADSVTR